MSPNLNSRHRPQHRILYEQLIYSTLRLVGVIGGGIYGPNVESRSKEEHDMQVSDKDLAVYANECSSPQCSEAKSCETVLCRLCSHCLSLDDKQFLRMAYLEHLNKHTCKRIYPEPITYNNASYSCTEDTIANKTSDKRITLNNAKMCQWFIGKCEQSTNWCE